MIKDNVLVTPNWSGFGHGISLFFALSPDVSRSSYTTVLDNLASADIQEVRFAGSTFTWDNPLRMKNVIPFKDGTTYIHRTKGKNSVDEGKGIDPVLDVTYADELAWRLSEAAKRDIVVQYTVFWGGTRAIFTDNNGKIALYNRIRPYIKSVVKVLKESPTTIIEIINECDHGHHMARLGQEGREEFLEKCARWSRQVWPDAIITASDGGHSTKFMYHDVKGLDYWNIHFPRDTLVKKGIPRWCRGSWHLQEVRHEWRAKHNKIGGHGRSDENIFLMTPAERQKWNYTGGTTDYRMYGLMMWVTLMAGAGLTIHSFKGFFCLEGLTKGAIFTIFSHLLRITNGFKWHNASSLNATWLGSPVKDWNRRNKDRDEIFKAYSIVNTRGDDVLVTVLSPGNNNRLKLNLRHDLNVYIYDPISGAKIGETTSPKGESWLPLPKAPYPKGLVIRMKKGAEPKPGPAPIPPKPQPKEVYFDHVIDQAYKDIFKRSVDPSGLKSYNEKMRQGWSEAEMRQALLDSPAYKKRFSK